MYRIRIRNTGMGFGKQVSTCASPDFVPYRYRSMGFGKQVSTCASPDFVPYRYRSMGFGKQLLTCASPEKILYRTGTYIMHLVFIPHPFFILILFFDLNFDFTS
jgi:hypothetical protein